jgi:serine/threonine protein kinase
MLRNLIEINSISVVQQSLSENIYGAKSLQYDEEPVGTGAFGSVYYAKIIDGSIQNNLLVKIITKPEFIENTYETIKKLHEKINLRQSNTKIPIYIEYPELSGLPFLLFKAKTEDTEEVVTGLLMFNLKNRGFRDFGEENWDKEKYMGVHIADKLYLAYQLAKGVEFLHFLKFIHSDLKSQSVFFNLNTPQISIIDYDGGYNYDSQNHSSTLGALQAWATPIFRSFIGLGKSTKDITVNQRLDEENWNIAVGLFETIFGIQPFYFLNDNEERTIEKYLKHNTWPNIAVKTDVINPQNISFHNNLVQMFSNLEKAGLKSIIDKFTQIFNDGYLNESKRLTSKEWKDLLFEINKEFIGQPKIEFFKAQKDTLDFKGDTIEFSWHGKYYRTVSIGGLIQTQNTNKIQLPLDKEGKVELKLTNDFGTNIESISIKANRLEPEIHIFSASSLIRYNLDPIVLNWETKHVKRVLIDHIEENLEPRGKKQVSPKEKTIYTLTAYGNFDQEVKAFIEIDVAKAQIIDFKYVINIEHGIDNIDLFWETENVVEVVISPLIGEVEVNGNCHAKIIEKINFTLFAKGHFNEIQKTIEAQPFPIPIIKGLFIPTPILNINGRISSEHLQIPLSLTKFTDIKLNTSVNFTDIEPNFIELNSKMKTIITQPESIPTIDKLFNIILKPFKLP